MMNDLEHIMTKPARLQQRSISFGNGACSAAEGCGGPDYANTNRKRILYTKLRASSALTKLERRTSPGIGAAEARAKCSCSCSLARCFKRSRLPAPQSFGCGMAAAEPCCISHAFERAASREPDRLAVIHAAASGGDGEERRFTYGDLLAAVGLLSRRIAAALGGTAPDARHDRGQSPGASTSIDRGARSAVRACLTCPPVVISTRV